MIPNVDKYVIAEDVHVETEGQSDATCRLVDGAAVKTIVDYEEESTDS